MVLLLPHHCSMVLPLLLLATLASPAPLRSTTVHRLLPSGKVRSHGGFLGGYGFRVSGNLRSFATPDFLLRPRGGARAVAGRGAASYGAPEEEVAPLVDPLELDQELEQVVQEIHQAVLEKELEEVAQGFRRELEEAVQGEVEGSGEEELVADITSYEAPILSDYSDFPFQLVN